MKWGCISSVLIIPLVILLPIILVVFLFTGNPAGIDDAVNGGKEETGCTTVGNTSSDKVEKVFGKNAKGTPLEDKGEYMLKSAKKHKIDPAIFIAIVANETGWGSSEAVKTHNNVAGLMGSGDLHKFGSIEDGIDAAAKNLYDLYFSQGLTTVDKIQKKYAPIGVSNDPTDLNSNWKHGVETVAKQLSTGKAETTCKNDSTNVKAGSIKGLEKILKKHGGKLPKTSHKVFNPNYYAYKECTWYVYNRRKELGLPVELTFGNGGDWAKKAKAQGYKTGKTPKVGSMVSWPYNSKAFGSTPYGHIAFVEEVKKNGEVKVSEHNIIPFKYGERTFKPEGDETFIY